MFYDLLIFIFMSYIKPQQIAYLCTVFKVVYRTIPTSNHNSECYSSTFQSLYIVLFLHQTTTCGIVSIFYVCCISYYSYIKPQPAKCGMCPPECCISYYSYIKPQPLRAATPCGIGCISYYSYIKPQQRRRKRREELYIVLFLHQTTTRSYYAFATSCCISYYSYIKPQRSSPQRKTWSVVYRTIPTSNHNLQSVIRNTTRVVYRTIPTSNHNLPPVWRR